MKKQPTQEQANSALECILGQKTVGFYPVIAKALGSAPAAIMVSQAFFWQYKAKFGSPIVIDGEQYFSKTVAEWYEETSVSESAQRLARSILTKHGIMVEKLAGLPASMHFRVDINALVAVINGYLSTGITVAAKHGNKERELTRTGSGKFRRQEATKDGDILNVETFETSESEGEGTPTPAPNPSNLQSQKNESGLVAPPGRDAAELLTKRISEEDFQDCLNRAAGNGKNAPLPKVAQKGIPPAYAESWPIDCKFCDGRGVKILGGGPVYCAECGGTGIEPAESNPQNFEVTAIASPTGLPGVTLVEAAPRPLRYDEYPNPRNANELKDRLKEYFTHHPEDWRLLIENAKVNWMPEKLEETTLAYCLHQEKEGNMKRTYNTYKAGLTTWFMRQKSWDAQNNAPKEGGQTRQNPPANYTSSTRH
jgi:hypothetical protein